MSDDYYLVQSNHLHSILDNDRSEFFILHGEKFGVKKWVIDTHRLPELDFYYTEFFQWAVSERLKDAMELKFTGLRYMPGVELVMTMCRKLNTTAPGVGPSQVIGIKVTPSPVK